MYIIEDGKAYLVDGEVGYQINFDTTGKLLVDKEKTIDIKGKSIYTYDEMYRKLNVAYMIEQAKKKKIAEETGNEFVEELNAKIDELTKENIELKKLLEEATKVKTETTNEENKENSKTEDETTNEENKENSKTEEETTNEENKENSKTEEETTNEEVKEETNKKDNKKEEK